MDGATLDTALKLVEIVSFVGAGLIFIFRGGVGTQKMEAAISALKDLTEAQGEQISELRTDFKQVTGILTQLAVQNTKLESIDKRVNMLDQRYEELRHGEGFVFPLSAHMSKVKSGG